MKNVEKKAAVIKITANKNRKEFVTTSEEILESEDSYKVIFNLIFSYFFEQIEAIRETKNIYAAEYQQYSESIKYI